MKPLDEAAWPHLVRPGSRIFIGGGASVPFALVHSMLRQADHFKDIELVHIHGLGETPWIDPKYADVLRTNSFFLTPALREAVERGQADYTPCPMSEVASLFENGPLPLDVALIQVSPPDADGWWWMQYGNSDRPEPVRHTGGCIIFGGTAYSRRNLGLQARFIRANVPVFPVRKEACHGEDS